MREAMREVGVQGITSDNTLSIFGCSLQEPQQRCVPETPAQSTPGPMVSSKTARWQWGKRGRRTKLAPAISLLGAW
jgi:hypothetical protein